MKKSTLLSLATAGAIVLTSAGTYAVWDTLSGTSTGQITVANSSVTVAATNMTFVEGTDTIGEDSIAYTGTAKFEVTGAGNNVNTMTLVPTVKNGDNIVNAADVDVTIKKGEVALTKTDANYTDTTLTSGDNEYTVEVTVKNKALAGNTLDVEVTGTASHS